MLGQLSWRVELFNRKSLESTVAGLEKNHCAGRQEEVDEIPTLALQRGAEAVGGRNV